MSRRKLSFTEKRRARLSMKFGRLERLETRNTVTEPISVTGLSLTAFSGLVKLGVMQSDGGNSALLGLARMAQQAKQGLTRVQLATAASNNSASLAIGLQPKHMAPGAGGGSGAVQGAMGQKTSSSAIQPSDWLASTSLADSGSSPSGGISIPWRPAARSGGGAALPPRGGSGNGAQAATIALVAGHGGRSPAQPQWAGAPTIPGYLASNLPQTAHAMGAASPVITRNAASAALGQGAASAPKPAVSIPAGPVPAASSGGVTIVENASSLPYGTTGNSSGAAMQSFAYFPLYTLDYNQGTVLFPGGYQLATLSGNMDQINSPRSRTLTAR